MKTFKATFGFPPSVNHMYGNRVAGKRVIRYVTAKGKQYKADIKSAIGSLPGSFKGPLSITLDFYPPDRRKRDVDNYQKCLQDALGDTDLIEDDSQFKKLEVFWHCPKGVEGTSELASRLAWKEELKGTVTVLIERIT